MVKVNLRQFSSGHHYALIEAFKGGSVEWTVKRSGAQVLLVVTDVKDYPEVIGEVTEITSEGLSGLNDHFSKSLDKIKAMSGEYGLTVIPAADLPSTVDEIPDPEEYLIQKGVIERGAERFPLILSRDSHVGTKDKIINALSQYATLYGLVKAQSIEPANAFGMFEAVETSLPSPTDIKLQLSVIFELGNVDDIRVSSNSYRFFVSPSIYDWQLAELKRITSPMNGRTFRIESHEDKCEIIFTFKENEAI